MGNNFLLGKKSKGSVVPWPQETLRHFTCHISCQVKQELYPGECAKAPWAFQRASVFKDLMEHKLGKLTRKLGKWLGDSRIQTNRCKLLYLKESYQLLVNRNTEAHYKVLIAHGYKIAITTLYHFLFAVFRIKVISGKYKVHLSVTKEGDRAYHLPAAYTVFSF